MRFGSILLAAATAGLAIAAPVHRRVTKFKVSFVCSATKYLADRTLSSSA